MYLRPSGRRTGECKGGVLYLRLEMRCDKLRGSLCCKPLILAIFRIFSVEGDFFFLGAESDFVITQGFCEGFQCRTANAVDRKIHLCIQNRHTRTRTRTHAHARTHTHTHTHTHTDTHTHTLRVGFSVHMSTKQLNSRTSQEQANAAHNLCTNRGGKNGKKTEKRS